MPLYTGRHGFDGPADGPSLQVGGDKVPYLEGDQHWSGDLLAGKDGGIKLEFLDAMIADWMTDPVTTATKPGTPEKKLI
jgi:hypothetical protein